MFGCPTSLFSRTIASQIGLLVWLHRNARFGRPQLASLVQAKSLSRLTSVRPPPSSSFSRGGEGALGCGGGARTPACGRWSTYARTLHRSSALSPARPDVLPGVAPPQPSRMAGSPCGCAPHGRRRSSPTRAVRGKARPCVCQRRRSPRTRPGARPVADSPASTGWQHSSTHLASSSHPSTVSSLPSPAAELDPRN